MRLSIFTAAGCMAAYALSYWMTSVQNPEISFWKQVEERRDREIKELRKEDSDTPIIFFTGGSSCAFSINPSIIEKETGLPCFNLGLPVAAGGEYIIHRAFERTRPGDILVIALEPDLFLSSEGLGSPSPFSTRMAHATGDIDDAAGGDFGGSLSLQEKFNFMRPGARYAVTYWAKAVLRRPYRYSMSDWRHHGRLETSYREGAPIPASIVTDGNISQTAVALLQTIQDRGKTANIRVCYTMPWQYTHRSIIHDQRTARSLQSSTIGKVIPVIDDGYVGCHEDGNVFSDSGLHLTEEGANERSRAIAIPLKAWLDAE